MLLSSLLLAYLASKAAAAVVAPHYIEHERRDHGSAADEWVKANRLHGEQILPFRVGLSQQNIDKGHDILMGMSDPSSDIYGQHWSEDEVIDFFAPHEDTVKSVHEWLIIDGKFSPERITHSANKQWLQIDLTVKELEELLQTEYHQFTHRSNGKRSIATDKYHIPHHIQDHVDYVTPGVRLIEVSSPESSNKRSVPVSPNIIPGAANPLKPVPVPPHLRSLAALRSDRDCDTFITPACIRKLYNFTESTTAVEGNSLALYESFNQGWDQDLLDGFYYRFTNNSISNGTSPIDVSVDGGRGEGTGGSESMLDLQCAFPIVYPQNITFFAVDDVHYDNSFTYAGLFNTFLDAIDGSYCNYTAFGISGNTVRPNPNMYKMDPVYPDKHKNGYKGQLQCGKFEPPNVISVSYSTTEFYTPMNYQRRQCNEFMKLGMQGVSVVMSTGDSGVANNKYGHSSSDNGCLWSPQDVDPAKNQTNFPLFDSGAVNKPVFNPGFPITCPYMTAVGSTELPKGAETKASEEIATSKFGSGGGFSNIYPRPAYQKDAVEAYFRDSPPPYKYYETTFNQSFSANGGLYNRAGRGFPDVSANGWNIATWSYGGVWKSGGTSASAPFFAALLTRINEERIGAGKSPVGFVNPALYQNPQVMNDITKGTNPGCGTKGFEAVKGWDPVTGLGTPNFPAMLDLFMSMP